MIGVNEPRSLYNPDLVHVYRYPSQKPFATLPKDADDRLVRDTISLQDHDPATLWPARSLERRRRFQTIHNRYYQQILYGCSNSHCETPTCLSRQRRVSKASFRPYTVLSARALAMHLASENDPEKGLCPYQSIAYGGSSESEADPFSSKGNLNKRTQSSIEGSSRMPRQSKFYYSTEPSRRKLSATIGKAKAHTANGHVLSSEVTSSHSDLTDDLQCRKASEQRRSTRKDPKSFIQNLFDTAAMQLLQLARLPETYLMWTQVNGEDRQRNANSEQYDTNSRKNPAPIGRYAGGRDDTKATGFQSQVEAKVSALGVTAPYTQTSRLMSATDRPIKSHSLDPEQSTAERMVVGSMESITSLSRNDRSIEPILHPQALACFQRDNVKALFETVNASQHGFKEVMYLREDMGRTNARLSDHRVSCPRNAEQFENILAFSIQSITYVLSNVEPLLQSFLCEHPGEHRLRMVSIDNFDSISEAFRLLNRLDIHPHSILPSLWISAGNLYLPGIARFNAPAKEGGRLGKQRLSNNLSSAPLVKSQECLGTLETCHIAKIILAALVGSVPKCDDGIWPAVCELRASGRVIHSPSVITPSTDCDSSQLESTVHAFEDEMALSLLLRLLRSLAGRHYIADVLQDQSLERRKHDIAYEYPFTFQSLVRFIACEGPLLHIADGEIRPTLKGVGLDNLGELQVAEIKHVSLLNLVEWLRTVILKEWDGKPEVLKCSAIGAALELLSEIRNAKFLGVEHDFFHTPFLAEQLDLMDVPVEWANSDTKMNSVHLLSYPFLFSPSVLISYFRAINYAAMYKAFETSAEAYDQARKVTRAYDPLGLGAKRLEERLNVAHKTCLVLEIRREQVLVDAMDQIWRRQKRELMRPLQVQLGMNEGEEGIDHGGVQQEFFRVAIAEALDPDYGAFITDSQSQMSWFHPCSLEPEYKFELLGLLTSLAIYNGLTLPFTFPRALYLKLLDISVTGIEDIEDGWPELAKGLKILRDWRGEDVEEVFSRPYVFSVDNFGTARDWHMDTLGENMLTSKHTLGTQSQIDTEAARLKEFPIPPKDHEWIARSRELPTPDRNTHRDMMTEEPQDTPPEPVMVTNANRKQYIRDYMYYLVDHTISVPFTAFRRGFFTCLNSKSITLFTADQLKALVEGLPDIDVSSLRYVTFYEGGYDDLHPTILMFWYVMHEWPQEKVRKLLEFVTASDRLPFGGMERLTFVIQKNGVGDARLPTSLTCYGRLLLPEYDDVEKLRKGLECAIENSKGFGTP